MDETDTIKLKRDGNVFATVKFNTGLNKNKRLYTLIARQQSIPLYIIEYINDYISKLNQSIYLYPEVRFHDYNPSPKMFLRPPLTYCFIEANMISQRCKFKSRCGFLLFISGNYKKEDNQRLYKPIEIRFKDNKFRRTKKSWLK